MMPEEGEVIGFLAISMARITGTLLLAVYYYSTGSTGPIISRSAMGILLIFLSVVLAHSGFQKRFCREPLVVTFCMTVSALWSNSGIIHLLKANGIITSDEEFRNAMAPGLVAIALAFMVIGCVGTLHQNGALSLMAFALGLANIHNFAFFYVETLGSSAIACNFLIVTVISVYLVVLPFFPFLAPIKSPTTKCSTKHTTRNHLVVIGIIANMVSSFVFGGKLLGVTNIFFIGQVSWLWTSALYQLVVSLLSFQLHDLLYATFFSLKAILKFAEGCAILSQPPRSGEAVIPLPFIVTLATLFLVLACALALRNIWDGLYALLFLAYCIALSCHPGGITHNAPQVINLIIFSVSIIISFQKLYILHRKEKVPAAKSVLETKLSTCDHFKVRARFPYSCNHQDVEIIGHAFDTITAFSITLETQATAYLILVAGSLVLTSGLLSLSHEKVLQSTVFIYYGIMWAIWGLTKYGAFYGTIRGLNSALGFNTAIGIICFLLLNCFIIVGTLVINMAWFLKCLALQILLISLLFSNLGIGSVQYRIVASVLFGVASFYCFLATLFNSVMERPQLPWGRPVFNNKGLRPLRSDLDPLPARKVMSIRKIAETLNRGGVCVIPTDVSYVVASACHCPDSVLKLSQIRMENSDNELSLFISSLSQLLPVRHSLGPTLWDHIEHLYPGPVGLVLSKEGHWLDHLGLTDCSMLGSRDTVSLYISDCVVATWLMDMVGPIVVKSLGISGQTLPRQIKTGLCGQVDGILLDLPHNKDYQFTVVDCTEIQRGIVSVPMQG